MFDWYYYTSANERQQKKNKLSLRIFICSIAGDELFVWSHWKPSISHRYEINAMGCIKKERHIYCVYCTIWSNNSEQQQQQHKVTIYHTTHTNQAYKKYVYLYIHNIVLCSFLIISPAFFTSHLVLENVKRTKIITRGLFLDMRRDR